MRDRRVLKLQNERKDMENLINVYRGEVSHMKILVLKWTAKKAKLDQLALLNQNRQAWKFFVRSRDVKKVKYGYTGKKFINLNGFQRKKKLQAIKIFFAKKKLKVI